jgi:pre-mRNA-splicing factor ATP-dependent RNA helicase DHX15/PRP43
MNPLNNREYTDKYYEIKKQWESLPANKQATQKELQKLFKEHSLILLTGETGSGKTTQVPKMLLEYFKYEKKVVCTQPKTIAAKGVSERVSDELDVKLGKEVGYQYSDVRKLNDDTKLRFITDGILTMQMFKEGSIHEYGGIIIDEAHERSIDIDVILYFLREYLKNRKKDPKKYPEIKIIIMSATIELDLFRNYFKGIPYGEISISGRTFPVEKHFLKKEPTDDYLKTIENILLALCEPKRKNIADLYPTSPDITKDKRDILVFLPSIGDLFNLQKKIEKNDLFGEENAVFLLYSGIPKDKEKLATHETHYKEVNPKHKRKIVLSTNVGETSITINGIGFVIESGLVINKTYNPQIRAYKIEKENIAKSSVKQRIGRAGRTQEGIAFHVYTEKMYDSFISHELPKIEFEDFTRTYLRFAVIQQKITEVNKLLENLIQPPNTTFILSAIERLEELGCIIGKEKQKIVTDLAVELDKFPTEPSISTMMVVSKHYKCSREATYLAIIMNINTDITKWFKVEKDKNNKPILPPIWKQVKHK